MSHLSLFMFELSQLLSNDFAAICVSSFSLENCFGKRVACLLGRHWSRDGLVQESRKSSRTKCFAQKKVSNSAVTINICFFYLCLLNKFAGQKKKLVSKWYLMCKQKFEILLFCRKHNHWFKWSSSAWETFRERFFIDRNVVWAKTTNEFTQSINRWKRIELFEALCFFYSHLRNAFNYSCLVQNFPGFMFNDFILCSSSTMGNFYAQVKIWKCSTDLLFESVKYIIGQHGVFNVQTERCSLKRWNEENIIKISKLFRLLCWLVKLGHYC